MATGWYGWYQIKRTFQRATFPQFMKLRVMSAHWGQHSPALRARHDACDRRSAGHNDCGGDASISKNFENMMTSEPDRLVHMT